MCFIKVISLPSHEMKINLLGILSFSLYYSVEPDRADDSPFLIFSFDEFDPIVGVPLEPADYCFSHAGSSRAQMVV